MAEHRVALPHGAGSIDLLLPDGWTLRFANPPTPTGSRSLADMARDALRAPVSGPRLRDLARPGASVTLAVTDVTRPCPDHLLVPLLIEELRAGGVRDEDITLLVALGMHRHTTREDREGKLGALAEALRIEDAQGGQAEDYRDLGTLALQGMAPPLPTPVPLRLHRRVTDCDLLVSTGVVEPHQYAGFSGGRKTVAIGCAGEETIRALHSIPFLEHPGTRLGSLEGNPLHAALEVIARQARLRFALNIALDGDRRGVAAAAGAPTAVLEDLTTRLAPFLWVPVGTEPFDAVLAGVGAPKDANLYQASRAFTYLAFGPRPVLREGGWVLLAARCEEGAGRGPGEEEFLACMRAGVSPGEVVARLRRWGFGAGGQRAFMVARALERYQCLTVACAAPAEASACHLQVAASPESAVARLRSELGERARVLVVPHAMTTIPILG